MIFKAAGEIELYEECQEALMKYEEEACQKALEDKKIEMEKKVEENNKFNDTSERQKKEQKNKQTTEDVGIKEKKKNNSESQKLNKAKEVDSHAQKEKHSDNQGLNKAKETDSHPQKEKHSDNQKLNKAKENDSHAQKEKHSDNQKLHKTKEDEITDKKNDIFAVLRLTNSLTYYTVKENFGSYKVGDELDQDVYNSLSKEEKSKCYSLMVDISFDPKILNMDLTNAFYLKSVKDKNNVKTVKLRRVLKDFDKYEIDDLIDEDTYKTINKANYDKLSDEYEYVSGIIINIDAISSGDIKFYKKDKFKDYTYPFINDESIIKVS